VRGTNGPQGLIVPLAIIFAGVSIAAAIAFTSHWSIVPVGGGRQGAYRLDRWTGEIIWCWHQRSQAPDRMECTQMEATTAAVDDWVVVRPKP